MPFTLSKSHARSRSRDASIHNSLSLAQRSTEASLSTAHELHCVHPTNPTAAAILPSCCPATRTQAHAPPHTDTHTHSHDAHTLKPSSPQPLIAHACDCAVEETPVHCR